MLLPGKHFNSCKQNAFIFTSPIIHAGQSFDGGKEGGRKALAPSCDIVHHHIYRNIVHILHHDFMHPDLKDMQFWVPHFKKDIDKLEHTPKRRVLMRMTAYAQA